MWSLYVNYFNSVRWGAVIQQFQFRLLRNIKTDVFNKLCVFSSSFYFGLNYFTENKNNEGFLCSRKNRRERLFEPGVPVCLGLWRLTLSPAFYGSEMRNYLHLRICSRLTNKEFQFFFHENTNVASVIRTSSTFCWWVMFHCYRFQALMQLALKII